MFYPDSFKNHFRALFDEEHNQALNTGDPIIGKIIKDQILELKKETVLDEDSFMLNWENAESILQCLDRLSELRLLAHYFDELIFEFIGEMQHGYRPAALSTF